MEVSELIKKVRKIEIRTRDISRHLFSGEYHSMFKGRGMAFSEVREYQYSDDVRHIDWNVTARTGVPFVKVFEEERELTVILMVDVSKSVFFGSKNGLKSDIITEISAVLAMSATQNHDKIGLILFSDIIEKFIPPAKGHNHVLRILRELVDFEPVSKSTNISQALEYLNRVIKQRSICFLISDFIDDHFAKDLKLSSRKHDLIAIDVYDPMEAMLTDVNMLQIYDPETGRSKWIDTHSERFKKAYEDFFVNKQQALYHAMGEKSRNIIHISTAAEDFLKPLVTFFKKR